MDNKGYIKNLLTQKLDEVIGGPKPVGDKLDSYYAYQAAKEKAKKDGKVWDKIGQDEKDRYVAVEMEKAGYEKKPGNTKWTRKPTEDEKKFADKVRADDERVRKMSTADKIDYYGKNPAKSTAGKDLSDDDLKKIELARAENQLEELIKKAEKAQEKMYDAEEEGDDDAYQEADEEHEYWYEKIQSLENKIEDLKYEIDNKKEETMKTFKEFKNINEAFSLTKGNFTQVKSLEKLLDELVKFAKKAGHKNFMIPPGSGADHQNKRDVSKPKGFYSPTLMSLIEGLYYTSSDAEDSEWTDKSAWSNKMSKTFPDKKYGGLDSEDAYDKDYGSIKGMRAQIFMVMTDFFEANPDFMSKFGSPEKATRMFIK